MGGLRREGKVLECRYRKSCPVGGATGVPYTRRSADGRYMLAATCSILVEPITSRKRHRQIDHYASAVRTDHFSCVARFRPPGFFSFSASNDVEKGSGVPD